MFQIRKQEKRKDKWKPQEATRVPRGVETGEGI